MKISTYPKLRILSLLIGFSVLAQLSACSSIPFLNNEPEPALDEPVDATQTNTDLAPQIKAAHPKQYTVKKGDTLWDISSLFLRDPWYWPEIWNKNKQIKNPHLIYPGDVLTLVYINGQPQINVKDGSSSYIRGGTGIHGLPVKVLKPSIRSRSIQASIATIPSDAIRQFLNKPLVVTRDELEDAPRIMGSQDGHLIMGKHDRVYIRGELAPYQQRYSVFRPGKELYDSLSGDVLGYEAIYTGNVTIAKHGDPHTGDLTFTEREVLLGDRLLAEDASNTDSTFFPKPYEDALEDGQIIALYDALFGVGRHQIVVLNKGKDVNFEVGNLVSVYRKGAFIHDRESIHKADYIKLPDERSGLVMIFKVFDRVSYGLVLEAKQTIHKNDIIRSPVR